MRIGFPLFHAPLIGNQWHETNQFGKGCFSGMTGSQLKVSDCDLGPFRVGVTSIGCNGIANTVKGHCNTAGMIMAGIDNGFGISLKLRIHEMQNSVIEMFLQKPKLLNQPQEANIL